VSEHDGQQVTEPGEPPSERLSEALRAAVERTIAVTAGGAEETRNRAGELLDEVARRGAAAGQGAREASATATGRLTDAIRELRTTGEAPLPVAERVEALERRLEALERALRGASIHDTNPKAEPETGP